MKSADKISTPDAIEYALEEYGVSVTKVTINTWCTKYGIGTKIGGRWYVNKKRLKLLLEGQAWGTKEDQKNQK